jgi:DNA-binding transcriptional ArsR family regulator
MPDKRQAAIFQTLADPTRLAIFEQLSRGESTVNALAKRLPISQPAVSQHLAVLRRPERLAKLKTLLDQQTKAQSQGDKA